MINIYACLCGDWVNLSADDSCTINGKSVYLWYEEGADIWAPFNREKENTYYQLDYLEIIYKNRSYRINPIFIQIVKK